MSVLRWASGSRPILRWTRHPAVGMSDRLTSLTGRVTELVPAIRYAENDHERVEMCDRLEPLIPQLKGELRRGSIAMREAERELQRLPESETWSSAA